MPKSVCFDVLGTCFHFQPLIDLISKIINRNGNNDKMNIDASTLFHSWFYAAQRDSTYLSICKSYTPIAQILQQTFRRACAIVDFPHPETNITDQDLRDILTRIKRLPPRDGLKECFDGLRSADWHVYAVTNGSKQASLCYYELADIQLDAAQILSCDDIKVAKPDPKVYENAKQWLESQHCKNDTALRNGSRESERWFVAAHSWDLMAARDAGFKTAWVAHEEGDPCTELFGDFDFTAKDLRECLEMIKSVE
ncbi:hypothetical protein LTR10_023711 [Elasticomyces elasticus]|uniref:Haloacid dehalogenase, type II n=1 Tax=Exophiala sideris TaxID=1016849 RepID=A0ABR0IUD9_9EURO|nr:hypothetical protein LTR10_023711 [Elasticomyces elasticus]KAK5020948.1 hypothetical protein LTS07_011329 [Exophiala sideris]KAK5023112.1 hypothetical protein LTR13_011318 [Exophiala sideris]KAK5048440.1 hypothetical protein LTR69_011354 [Exophiala sideris]KAK5176094.1 hypothetical protein LTR44_011339 [Eurotiomycetes sp. CCFEE 6388]